MSAAWSLPFASASAIVVVTLSTSSLVPSEPGFTLSELDALSKYRNASTGSSAMLLNEESCASTVSWSSDESNEVTRTSL